MKNSSNVGMSAVTSKELNIGAEMVKIAIATPVAFLVGKAVGDEINNIVDNSMEFDSIEKKETVRGIFNIIGGIGMYWVGSCIGKAVSKEIDKRVKK